MRNGLLTEMGVCGKRIVMRSEVIGSRNVRTTVLAQR